MEASMRTLRTLLVGSLILVTTSAPAVHAQERHVVDPAALAAAVSNHVAKQDADRTAIREALARPEVLEVAAKTGVDLDRLRAAVGTLSGGELERAATAARQVNDRLVGGATIVITTTTIIIALLIVILIIVAVD
jgi:hypothetical protein